jgi:hypothetical protein
VRPVVSAVTEPWRYLVGRASKRKKAQRQAGPGSRQVRLDPPHGAGSAELYFGRDDLDEIVELARVRVERERAVRQAWEGDAETEPEVPNWPEGSLGDRFLTGFLGEAQDAPSLLTGKIPDAAVITADPAHWTIAVSALIRAVIFDGLPLDHPAVSALLEVLAPIAAEELAHWAGDPEVFPVLDGPLHALGARALAEATWALVGNDPLGDVLGVLKSALDSPVSGETGQVVAMALIGAAARHYRFGRPGDAEVIEQLGPLPGNALETLIAAGAVPPGDVLRAGLTVLSILARLGLSSSASVLEPTA